MRSVMVNGVEGAGLPGDDPGFTRGLNVFETMRTYGRRIFRLEQHIDRLCGSASRLELPLPPRALMTAELEQLALRGENLLLRIALTAGGNRVCSVEPVPEPRIGRPLRVATVEMEPSPFLPGTVKHGSRASWVLAARELRVDEVMFIDDSGFILECNRSNVFGVIDGVLCTPELDGSLLPGVTRSALLQAARELRMPLEIGLVPINSNFSELYVSSTIKEIAPVLELDGERLPCWGPIGRALQNGLRLIIQRECG